MRNAAADGPLTACIWRALGESLAALPETYDGASWRTLANVLERALTGGSSFDFPESGVALPAARRREGHDAVAQLTAIHTRVAAFGPGSPSVAIGAYEFATTDTLSALAPPVAIWRIPSDVRVAALSQDLFYACQCAPTVWEDAFQSAGLALERVEGWWVIRGGSHAVRFSVFNAKKLEVGVASSGISPRAVAAAILAETGPL